MGKESFKINRILLPLSWIYGSGVWLRNRLFDWKFLKSRTFPLPIISIGNITVGGTGKTPHTEYLIDLLKSKYRIAVLSRGYKRATKGFIIAGPDSNASQIGDEPQQIKEKFKDITVVVDEDRCEGIDRLLSMEKRPDVILLDDAFQHRYVKPGLSILLTSYDRPFTNDCLMPAGRLREHKSGMERADIIIVTKCPNGMTPIEFRIKHNELTPYPYQKVFFTRFRYGNLEKMSDRSIKKSLNSIKASDKIILVTGIANPQPMVDEISKYSDNIKLLGFPDHHNFSSEDIIRIIETFNNCSSQDKYLITTEKDAARLALSEKELGNLKEHIYILPIKVEFISDNKYNFNQIIEDYVRENSRNSSISEK